MASQRSTPKYSLSSLPGFTSLFIDGRLLEIMKYGLFVTFALLVVIGFGGPQIGAQNPTLILIWVGWWLAIMVFLAPVAAKFWCAVCPIPLVGQLFHRYAPLRWIRNHQIPRRLTLFGFLPLLLFLVLSSLSVPLSTVPWLTALGLSALVLGATVVDVLFEERTFCKYICPINALLSVFGRGKLLRVETLEPSVCLTEHERTCLYGDERNGSWGCSWGLYPGNLTSHVSECSTCLECLRSCSQNNLTVALARPNFLSTRKQHIPLHQAFAPLFFLGIGMVYVLSKVAVAEPLHKLILVHDLSDLLTLLLVEFLAVAVVMPLFFMSLVGGPVVVATRRARSLAQQREIFGQLKRSTFTTIPLGLSIWFAFSLVLIMPQMNSVLNLLGFGEFPPLTFFLAYMLELVVALSLAMGFVGSSYLALSYIQTNMSTFYSRFGQFIGLFTFLTICYVVTIMGLF